MSATISVDISRNTAIGLAAVSLLALAIGFVSLSSGPQNVQAVQSVDSDAFEQVIEDPEVFVLQVHTPYYGEIAGTDLVQEDWENVDGYLDQLPEDRETPIAIYCRSGRMSGIVADTLEENGYTTIYDLDGGMNAWEASGRELVAN